MQNFTEHKLFMNQFRFWVVWIRNAETVKSMQDIPKSEKL